VMEDDAFDLAGFCVGAVDEEALLGPDRVVEGDVLIGLASTGLHANGYSLVRSAVLPAVELAERPSGLSRPLADELLEPCAIYAPDVVRMAREGLLHSAAHVTGGGLRENLPRALPEGLGATVERGSWPEPAIFGLVRSHAEASDEDMFATFNMGVGIVLVVPTGTADAVLDVAGHEAYRIGSVTAGGGFHLV
jgi:phosphoribosylformylglycinamidine cyclo-ligase